MVQRFRAEDSGSCRLKLAHCKSQGASLTGHLATTRCPPRVKLGLRAATELGLLFPHVWTAPSWQELSSRLQHWSVRPCVRPFSAVHMTAGHNALRGSGPDQ